MGHFETDSHGNMLIVRKPPAPNKKSELVDALGRRVNRSGYLVDEKGNVINKFGDLVVKQQDLDPMSDEIPPEIFDTLFIPQ